MATPLLFSDVDGTLIGRDFAPLLPRALLAEAEALARLVLVSSRSLEELTHLRDQLGIAADLIAENGALVATTDAALAGTLAATGTAEVAGVAWHLVPLAEPREVAVERALAALEAAGITAIPADALPAPTFAALSRYDIADAERALRRRHAALFAPLGEAGEAVLRAAGLSASFGGRWTSVVLGADKGEAVRRYRAAWEAQAGRCIAVGVGDAPNDVPMLRAVDLPFAIPGDRGRPAAALLAVPGVVSLPAPGAAGWRSLLDALRPAVVR